MKHSLDFMFDYDFDSNLYMLSKDPEAKNWKVIVHGKDGKKYVPSIEKFFAYPECPPHEGEAAWLVEYYSPTRIEIQQPGLETVSFKHPNGSE